MINDNLKLRYELWQTVWQDISLESIAREQHIKKGEVVSAAFFEAFYRRLRENDYHFQKGWLDDKKKFAEFLMNMIDKLMADIQQKKIRILSVGCGIGVIESYIIKKGYHVELQECQEESFHYLKSQGIKHTEWVTATLTELPSNTYDLIWTNLVLYSLDDDQYQALTANIARILKPNGKFIMIDTAAQWSGFMQEKKANLSGGKKEGIFWGYVRSVKEHKRLLRKSFVIDRDFWIAKTHRGSYRKCNPVTFLGFNVKGYKNADVVSECIICKK